MREVQKVFIESYDGKVHVRTDDPDPKFVCDVIETEAIVLTPEQYKEDMMKFAEWVSGNTYHTNTLNGKRYWITDNQETVNSSELFDLYQKETKEKAV